MRSTSDRRPTLAEFRAALGKVAEGMTDADLQRLQNEVEWFAKFAVEQMLAAKGIKP